MLHQIKAQQFYTDLGLQKIVEFKDFLRLLSDFPVFFKEDLIFNDFSRKPSKFKHFSSLCAPCNSLSFIHIILLYIRLGPGTRILMKTANHMLTVEREQNIVPHFFVNLE